MNRKVTANLRYQVDLNAMRLTNQLVNHLLRC